MTTPPGKRCDLTSSVTMPLDSCADLLAGAAASHGRVLEKVLLQWDHTGRASTAAREGDHVTLRDCGVGDELLLRARPGGRRERPAPSRPKGDEVPVDELAAWAQEVGLFVPRRGTLFADGCAVLGVREAAIPVAPGLSMRDCLCALLVCAYALPEVAERHLASSTRGGIHPLFVNALVVNPNAELAAGPLWAVARLHSSNIEAMQLDVDLVDTVGQVVTALVGLHLADTHQGALLRIVDIGSLHGEAGEGLTRALAGELARRLAQQLDLDEVSPEQPLAALGMDSLQTAELLVAIELTVGVDLLVDRLRPDARLLDLAALAVQALEKRPSEPPDDFALRVNPELAERLAIVGMDHHFQSGSGHRLVDAEGREILDCVAQYGALPFGHNPPEIWQALDAVRRASLPSFASLSIPGMAGELAARLLELAPHGLERAFFCTSGAEAVEAAIKLARSATGRNGVLSTHGGFHGLTLGALSATGRNAYHASFGAPVEGFDHVEFGEIDALCELLAAAPQHYAAFIVEPLQAEGGIIEAPSGYLAEAARACRNHGVLFVADEVQTGLGRLGTMFASAEASPDIITLAKALGGGLVPVGAMLYRAELANTEFLLRHGSTFGSTSLGAAAAQRTLDLLTADDGAMLCRVRDAGAWLRGRLESVAARHARTIVDVRGCGYLQGVEFATEPAAYPSAMANLLCQWEAFGLVLASYLLHRHGIRVAPALSANAVLRIEPPLNTPPEALEPLVDALEDLAGTLESGDSRRLLGHLVGEPSPPLRSRPAPAPPRRLLRSVTCKDRFAFLVHLMGLDDLMQFDPSLAGADPDAIARARGLLMAHMKPAVLTELTVEARDGRRAGGEVILVPHTARELVDMSAAEATRAVLLAAELAEARGAGIIGLGGFCSVVTDAGANLKSQVPLTTGNGFTAVSATTGLLQCLARISHQESIDLKFLPSTDSYLSRMA